MFDGKIKISMTGIHIDMYATVVGTIIMFDHVFFRG